ncbi:MAG: xanthine dehydrogenase family protein molybdopterin-binding subunit, partial [Candidatus Rokubacteria bacterium]|nr:xanthine dehydrogenase family protein molybdopterin-binding subunit [Candidatus Rokubacteria bacterium]
MGAKYFGAVVRRKEDPRLLTGRGRYVDDIQLAGMAHAAVLRSPHASARLRGIDAGAARSLPGVLAVFTHADLADRMKPLLESGVAPPGLVSRITFTVRSGIQYPLARDRVHYVGEAVA